MGIRAGKSARRSWLALTLSVAGLFAAQAPPVSTAVAAEQTPKPDRAALPGGGSAPDQDPRLRLRGLEDTLHASEMQRRKLEEDIVALRTDRGRLNTALIDMTARTLAAEGKVASVESSLTGLIGKETAIRRSLGARRDVIAQVLAALQRMGRKPPPAVLVRPDDMLQAIRTSMLLGSVVPQLRAETETLALDLAELVRLRSAIGSERAALQTTVATLVEQQRALEALMEARQGSMTQTQSALGDERKRSASLAEQTQSLRDLITETERLDPASLAAARSAEAVRKSAQPGLRGSDAVTEAPFRDPARLTPQVAFVDTKGMLPLPAAGPLVRRFGESDPFGGTDKGVSIATRASAVVLTPADGWVAFAGTYRSYGKVLIINAGNGYYIVLAGLSRISVDPRQFVLSGEPVGVMGDGAVKSAAAMAVGAAGPVLYVEFRKDGVAVDPGSWWSKPGVEKVRG